MQFLKKLTIDTSALRQHAEFRRMFFGQTISQIGSEIALVALMYQVYVLTKSSLAVGAVGIVVVVPTVVFSLLGGAIADAMDRRKLLLIVQVKMVAVACLLAWSTHSGGPLWTLYALAAAGAMLKAVDAPARGASIPALVSDTTLRSAIQVREIQIQLSRILGPVAGGMLIGAFGTSTAFLVDASTFLIAFITFLTLPPLMPTERRRFELSSITEGVAFVFGQKILASTFVADLIAMIVGMPRALFPALALTVFDAGPEQVGWLFAAPAAGAIFGLVFAGAFTHRVEREGRAILISVSIWGLAIVAAGLAPTMTFALIFLAIAGWADMISALFRQTMLLQIVPDRLRGRMSAVHTMVVTGGPPLGDAEAGVVAALAGIRASIVIGGFGCVVGTALLHAWCPEFARWRR